MINLNNKKLSKELLLNLFSNFIQKQGKSIKAKKLIINISNSIDSKLFINSNFISILEYIIYKLFLPMSMIKNQKNETKYYFLVVSLLKYIKKFVFSPFIQSVKGHKKFPFIYNFLAELQKILKTESTLLEHKDEVIDVFMDTSSNIQLNKYVKSNKNNTVYKHAIYTSYKLKYSKRYIYYTRIFDNIKLNNVYCNTKINNHIKNYK
uniref:Ribosomal protein S7 n=2 Tax=Babesia TaxID=5864 RepID=A0A411ADA7_9APIC|nr:ribosomal protein S7 [Babesia sp. Lintan]QAX27037.1 ribosomal protein S7 [Babesia motasi]QAX27068.1 ribosomal protein S7 [Babesia motasi]